jgi:DNA excision repair protein ERCC-4
MRDRKTLQTRDIVFLVDTREQTPLDFSPLLPQKLFRTAPATLETGDYSVRGLEREVAVERKSVADLVMCVGKERERFEREMHRLLAYPARCVLVEGLWSDIENGFDASKMLPWRSQVTPAAVVGSVQGWMAHGIPFHFAADRVQAARFTANFMWIATQRRFRQLADFYAALPLVGNEEKPDA